MATVDLEEGYWPESCFPSAPHRHCPRLQCQSTLQGTRPTMPAWWGSPASCMEIHHCAQGYLLGLLHPPELPWTARSQRRLLHSHQTPSSLVVGTLTLPCRWSAWTHTSAPSPEAQKFVKCACFLTVPKYTCKYLKKKKTVRKKKKKIQNCRSVSLPIPGHLTVTAIAAAKFRFCMRILNTVIIEGKVRGKKLWLVLVIALKGFSGQIF